MSTNEIRKGDWMQTANGRRFWPIDPRPDDVFIDDIAHSLAHQCRFAGHVRVHYSVGEHSVRASIAAEKLGGDKILQLAVLLHDASEAYVVDVPRPLKPFLAGYKDIEARVARCVEARFGLPDGATEWPLVKHVDEVMLATEARDVMGGECAGKWTLRAAPLPDRIEPWDADVTRRRFLDRFALITEGR